jgi:hypothetical protein
MTEKPILNSGMGSLFSTKKEGSQSGALTHESRDKNHKPQNRDEQVVSREPRVITPEASLIKHEPGIKTMDSHTLELAVSQGCKDPRISAYSPFVMSVLRYLRKTTPEFSMSEVASSLLEDAIREKYPELSEQVEKALAKK